MVKTAVLMATYNGQGFIHDQLDSIRNQTLRPDYVLMRDDGSTDDTVKVVEDYIKEHRLDGWSITSNDKNLGWRLNFRQLLIDVLAYEVDYVFLVIKMTHGIIIKIRCKLILWKNAKI